MDLQGLALLMLSLPGSGTAGIPRQDATIPAVGQIMRGVSDYGPHYEPSWAPGDALLG